MKEVQSSQHLALLPRAALEKLNVPDLQGQNIHSQYRVAERLRN